ncbi:MAG: uracil-DNA glycosylase, partial [Candidatus Cloacimonetes bacterium]|nr:uracil-DNA glycosylase [Candidatus Cloacimonadota bacterium]
NINIHHSWNDFIKDDFLLDLDAVEKEICNFNPPASVVLKFLEMDICKVKVVILGQDPYPQEGKATGRAFEVGDLINWSDKFRQTSLKNIVRLLYFSYTDELLKYNDIRREIQSGNFKLLPPNKLFIHWESQGVLLLNTSLTVTKGYPGSHTKLWVSLTDKLIKYICITNKNVKWFLWGKHAQRYRYTIKAIDFYECNHPMICSKKNPRDFINCLCFKQTKNVIDWLGETLQCL